MTNILATATAVIRVPAPLPQLEALRLYRDTLYFTLATESSQGIDRAQALDEIAQADAILRGVA